MHAASASWVLWNGLVLIWQDCSQGSLYAQPLTELSDQQYCMCAVEGKVGQVKGVFGEEEDEDDGGQAGPGPSSAAAAEGHKGASKLDELMRKVGLGRQLWVQ
jgi:hypothetical protein